MINIKKHSSALLLAGSTIGIGCSNSTFISSMNNEENSGMYNEENAGAKAGEFVMVETSDSENKEIEAKYIKSTLLNFMKLVLRNSKKEQLIIIKMLYDKNTKFNSEEIKMMEEYIKKKSNKMSSEKMHQYKPLINSIILKILETLINKK